jgi:hypothetical protein
VVSQRGKVSDQGCHEVKEFDWLLITQALGGRNSRPAGFVRPAVESPANSKSRGNLEFGFRIMLGHHCLRIRIRAISNPQVFTGKRADTLWRGISHSGGDPYPRTRADRCYPCTAGSGCMTYFILQGRDRMTTGSLVRDMMVPMQSWPSDRCDDPWSKRSE